MTNAQKYAEAKLVRVAVSRADGIVTIEVDDDGVGGADASGGSGLVGLRDRIEALGGRLRLDSPPGGGTHIVAELPAAV